VTPGFLLTRQWADDRDGIRLDFWLSTAQGPMSVSIHGQKALFFIRQPDVAGLEQRGMTIKPLQLKSFSGDPVSAVYFDSQQQLYRARDRLTQQGVACYESDIRPTERFLCERFITASIDVDADYSVQPLHNVRLQPGDFQPSFEVMSFDIESDYESSALFSIAFVSSQTRRVLMIGDGADDETIEYVADERALLARWIEWVARIDPDILIGWNVINFDLRLLQDRAQALGVPLAIGRAASLPQWRQSQADRSHYFVRIPGRVVLDGIETLRSATFNFPSFALEAVARDMLGRGKLIHQSGQTDPLYKAKQIRRQFNEDKPQLAAYNLEDCQLVWEIFEHADLIKFSIERARLTGLEMDRAGGSVAAFDNLYLPRLHRKGYIAPNIGDYQGELSAPGGYVMDSRPGLQESVLVLDYKSLYPSIIRTFRVDPYARIAAKQADPTDVIAGYDGASFHKQDHILPQIIENLWAARDEAKRESNAALSQAIKIIMNSFYGVLGTSGCRVHDSRLTSSITKRGHDIIIQTVKLIEAQGYEVIYGDTDSVFVSLNGSKDNQAAGEIGDRLVEHINRYWRDHDWSSTSIATGAITCNRSTASNPVSRWSSKHTTVSFSCRPRAARSRAARNVTPASSTMSRAIAKSSTRDWRPCAPTGPNWRAISSKPCTRRYSMVSIPPLSSSRHSPTCSMASWMHSWFIASDYTRNSPSIRKIFRRTRRRRSRRSGSFATAVSPRVIGTAAGSNT